MHFLPPSVAVRLKGQTCLAVQRRFPFFGLRKASDLPKGLSKSATLSVAPFLRTSLGALLVALSYYAGSELGFFLKPAHTEIATFWPPSAILLAAFLLAPTRMWWVFLLMVLPAHLLVQLQDDTSLLTALGWFIANTCGALLGAACIRRFKKEETLFDSLEGIIIFLTFGVLLPDLVKSFLSALATLQTGRESNYWMLWTTRLSSNFISNLILVPTIVIFWRNAISWLRSAKLARHFEAGALAVAIVGVSFLIFSGENQAGSIPTALYALLPLLFWAAVRFGLGGLSASLLGVAAVSIWFAIHGRGPVGPSATLHDVLVQRIVSIHSLLIVSGLPLMLVAALIAERRCSGETLRKTRGKLIYAQEQECHRIARELQEDITQRLTLVCASVDELRAASNAAATQPLNRLHNRISDAFNATLHLSNAIHPFMVEYLGLARALIKLCRDTGTKSGLTINCSVEELLPDLPADVSHRLFRVAQEALQNIIQSSDAKTVAVELKVGGGRMLLRIADDGIGVSSQRGQSTGLAYMREQTLSLGGAFNLMSTPGRGMVIEVSVPIKAIT
jgi:signal transduction histidine kinase